MRKSRKEVCAFLAGYYTCKLRGKVWSAYDQEKRAYSIQGEGLPAHPAMQSTYPHGWNLLDFIAPAKARALMR